MALRTFGLNLNRPPHRDLLVRRSVHLDPGRRRPAELTLAEARCPVRYVRGTVRIVHSTPPESRYTSPGWSSWGRTVRVGITTGVGPEGYRSTAFRLRAELPPKP